MSLHIVDAGPLVTVQDSGRLGYARFGVPASGPMDWFGFRAAQALVGNTTADAAIEVGAGDLVLSAEDDLLIAASGAGYELRIQSRPRPFWMALQLRRGWTLELTRTAVGCWAYLAIAGGISAPRVLGSAATYVRGGLGGLAGRALRGGDSLPIGKTTSPAESRAGLELPAEARPGYGESVTVEVVIGPQSGYFSAQAMQKFLEDPYRVSAASDRMGYRLEGPPLHHSGGADIISDGMVMGCVQVPADGQPLVMMADGPTTGGYPKIAAVVNADLPLVAQCTPGRGELRFRATTVEAAQARYRQLQESLSRYLALAEPQAVMDW